MSNHCAKHGTYVTRTCPATGHYGNPPFTGASYALSDAHPGIDRAHGVAALFDRLRAGASMMESRALCWTVAL